MILHSWKAAKAHNRTKYNTVATMAYYIIKTVIIDVGQSMSSASVSFTG